MFFMVSRLIRDPARARRRVAIGMLVLASSLTAGAQVRSRAEVLSEADLARGAFGSDAAWYRENIPFFEIDDAAIQRTYYYRWQLYRSHMREIGSQGTAETEFLPGVPWARHPFEDLNDSSSFHILEGRWLRNPVYVTALLDHLYTGGGNDRHFSESIAAAALAWTEVTGDTAPALRHLDAMQHVYNLWDDHFDASRGMYWIEPLLDATEYTISSIDASGAGFTDTPSAGNNGFMGGYAFRPSINAYQYGNARAIAAFAQIAGQEHVAQVYTRRAEDLRSATLKQLWNPALQHFTDVYQRSTKTVTAGDFIRGRELVGYVPWQFELLPTRPEAASPEYNAAWRHALLATELGGLHGLRTVEPSYPRYMVQYRYDAATDLPECQWNGPSWPFQTSQTLSAMANLLNDYDHVEQSANDYVHLLRQYTQQHLVASDKLDLQENYNPDTGGPIVGLPRSHHYNHSTYNDLVLSGLLGIRPHMDEVFELHPLLPLPHTSEPPIRYFALQHLRYHGHDLTILYDADGSRYGRGAGVTIFSDGMRLVSAAPLGRIRIPLKSKTSAHARSRVDLAVNVWGRAPSAFQSALPIASASSAASDAQIYEAIDGRQWFYPEIAHGWSPAANSVASESQNGAASNEDWIAVDLRQERLVGSVELAFFGDGKIYSAPASVRVQVRSEGVWTDVPLRDPARPVSNTTTVLSFTARQIRELRVVIPRSEAGSRVRLISLRAFGPVTSF